LFFFSSRRRHTRFSRDWSSDVCSSDLFGVVLRRKRHALLVPRNRGQRLRTEIRPAVNRQLQGAETRVRAQPFCGKLIRADALLRSEERRVGKEGGHRGTTIESNNWQRE